MGVRSEMLGGDPDGSLDEEAARAQRHPGTLRKLLLSHTRGTQVAKFELKNNCDFQKTRKYVDTREVFLAAEQPCTELIPGRNKGRTGTDSLGVFVRSLRTHPTEILHAVDSD